ncbi:hypothetical protein, partial [Myxococcus sp. AB025B]|uniref:hypothetical protein n=1 Tax=Myxococcus sp. AB025B TaxID=2562794 RepID=UPI001E59F0ED
MEKLLLEVERSAAGRPPTPDGFLARGSFRESPLPNRRPAPLQMPGQRFVRGIPSEGGGVG